MIEPAKHRDTLFISKATPLDDAFALWLAPRLEAAGYKVFADILDLQGGDRWRTKITNALRHSAMRMLLCCSDRTLARPGVLEEIEIASDLSRELSEPNFIIPLRLEPFQKLFGIGGLQWIDFHSGWARGLAELERTLTRQELPRAQASISPDWAAYLRRAAITVRREPEPLTSNWLRIVDMPDKLWLLVPRNSCSEASLKKLAAPSILPLVPFEQGFLTFAAPFDLDENFAPIGGLRQEAEFELMTLLQHGSEEHGLGPRDARSIVTNLLRQAWEKRMRTLGFFERTFSSGASFHVDASKLDIGKRVPWGRQGQTRSSMLRNVAKNRIWEYGVSATPNFFPYPHLKLKGRVLFSERGENDQPVEIEDDRTQFRLRRSVCSVWRNKAWHGRLMAFMELLAGESPFVDLPVGRGLAVTLDAAPVEFTAPVSARQVNRLGEDAEETDETTVTRYYEEDDL